MVSASRIATRRSDADSSSAVAWASPTLYPSDTEYDSQTRPTGRGEEGRFGKRAPYRRAESITVNWFGMIDCALGRCQVISLRIAAKSGAFARVFFEATESVSRPETQSGRANATYASPDFVPIFPPPAAMTTYCLPFTSYVAGVA